MKPWIERLLEKFADRTAVLAVDKLGKMLHFELGRSIISAASIEQMAIDHYAVYGSLVTRIYLKIAVRNVRNRAKESYLRGRLTGLIDPPKAEAYLNDTSQWAQVYGSAIGAGAAPGGSGVGGRLVRSVAAVRE